MDIKVDHVSKAYGEQQILRDLCCVFPEGKTTCIRGRSGCGKTTLIRLLLGLDIPDGVIEAYERVKDQVNLPSIDARERVTRHDVKARIEEFCELAGCEHIHKGMTSRDLTENVEQLQIWKSMQIIRDKAVAVLNRMSALAEQWKHVTIAGRTHNVAAQTTTMGKRVAMFGEDIVHGLGAWISLMDRYSVRGLKGAVGTQLDQLSLLSLIHI